MDSTMHREMEAQCMAEEAAAQYIQSCHEEAMMKANNRVGLVEMDSMLYWKMEDGSYHMVTEQDKKDVLYEARVNRDMDLMGDSMCDKNAPLECPKPTPLDMGIINNKVRERMSTKKKSVGMEFPRYGVDSDMGMMYCSNDQCLSNTVKEHLTKLAAPWGLVNEAGYVEYPNYKKMLDTAISMLKERDQFIPMENLKPRVWNAQKRLYRGWSFMLELGAMMNSAGHKGFLQEVADEDSKMGGAKLVCPYCGSEGPVLAWLNHDIDTDILDSDLPEDSKMDPEYRASEYLYEKECREYRKELDMMDDDPNDEVGDDILDEYHGERVAEEDAESFMAEYFSM